MTYLIDTDIASYYLRAKFNLSGRFEEKGRYGIRISRVSMAELEVLAYKNPQSKINLSSIAFFCNSIGIIDPDHDTWRLFSEMKAGAETSGRTRGDFDILIAATARRHNMILVTNNVAHFQDLIATENWTQP